MDLLFQASYDVATLTAKIAASGLPMGPRFFGVSADNKRTFIHLPDDSTTEEQAIIQTALESYDWTQDLKNTSLEKLHQDCTDYIFAHYDSARQASLNALLTEGVIYGWVNRIGYVGSALTWIKTVIAYYYAKQDAITAATSAEEINSVSWNFSEQFDATDPNITLRQASDLTS